MGYCLAMIRIFYIFRKKILPKTQDYVDHLKNCPQDTLNEFHGIVKGRLDVTEELLEHLK